MTRAAAKLSANLAGTILTRDLEEQLMRPHNTSHASRWKRIPAE